MSFCSISTLLRLAGLTVWLTVCAEYLAASLPPPAGESPAAFWFGQGVIGLFLLAFAVAFWRNMRDIPVEQTRRGRVLLLLLQLLPAMLISQDLSYIVALESALVLPRRQALQWIAGQVLIMFCLFMLFEHFGLVRPSAALLARDPNIASGVTLMSVLTWQIFSFFGGWFAAGEALSRREAARLNAELLLAQQSLAEESRAEERLRISRELHDSVGHHLVALGLQLDLARRVEEPARSTHIATAGDIARRMLAEVRQVVAALRRQPAPDLRRELASICRAIPEPCIHMQLADEALAALEAAVGAVLLRAVQEAVSNTLRHGRARNLWIVLRRIGDELLLAIRDDGQGAGDVICGNGLTGMRERVTALAGSLRIDAAPGRGFALEIRLPIRGVLA
ncbi:MAG: hypothetical protein BWK76_05125 [Desulfobulbaceae bacterium A2]|nr:MAG: hypothetical protein BWK76_05125 [Desulfobulbaceae bacterium A2]